MYEGEIKRFKVWFEHPQGPYSAIHWGVDHAHVDRVWQASPFYIGSQAPGETPPGVVAEWFRYHGKPVPLNDESEPREPKQYTAVERQQEEHDPEYENDALYQSRDQMPVYQSNDLDYELARAEWERKHGDRDGEPEDYGLSEDDLDYDWDQFVGGDEPNPEWYQLEENERRQRRDDEDTIPMEEIDPADYEDPEGHTCVQCGQSTDRAGLPHCPHCGYDGTGQYVTLPQPEHDNDDRREAYYQAGLFPPSFLY